MERTITTIFNRNTVPGERCMRMSRLKLIKNQKLPTKEMLSVFAFIGARAPLDFSFRQLEVLDSLFSKETREDDSSKLYGSEDILFVKSSEQTNLSKQEEQPKTSCKKSLSRSLRLNNNFLNNIENLPAMVQAYFQFPTDLAWLDLSFNYLKTISSQMYRCPNLQILYMHGNAISNLNDIDNLVPLTKLTKLTLHGNPIEQIQNYRIIVISRLLTLREFDFSCVSLSDRESGERMLHEMKVKKTRKKTN
ncbi:leucine-rich repeat-containing protein 51 [Octopus bimaculoides]|uniref:Leucine-rich repeat-containing protein 51 n=1 Tax=Octopus bimaculoides TaxID=37653 RepID=A0A0L8IA29_OCTBM|nr:leucine-rich repeat-containing protein 51 [Octopus bimaculoides]|eukprot:XP_014782438.1 PREDICTED: leucine-rich repeat-containing protein 51-like [Octopus bimaculoides]